MKPQRNTGNIGPHPVKPTNDTYHLDTSDWSNPSTSEGQDRLLRQSIPIRGEWTEEGPGWLEADTVALCGGSLDDRHPHHNPWW